MTTSIVFDNEDIQTFNFITFDENYKTYVEDNEDDATNNDISGALYALQRLRYLKTRETGNSIVEPDITGRDPVKEIDFSEFTYEQYKHRRKAEVLKYKNSNQNSRSNYSNVATNNQFSNDYITNFCSNNTDRIIYKPGTNSGIKGSSKLLYLNNSVKFYSSI